MYYILHFIVAFLYMVPAACTDIYTKITADYEYVLIKTILVSCVGIIYGIIHFSINYLYLKKEKVSPKLALYYPIAIMAVFAVSFFRNLVTSRHNTVGINHPGFYILMLSLIIFSLASYIICNYINRKREKRFKGKAVFHFKKYFSKKIVSKIFIFIVILFFVTWTAELIKNEIFTFKYGGQFEDLVSIKENLGDYESFKVIDYSPEGAHLYYVTNYEPNPIGTVVYLVKSADTWIYKFDSVVWSTMGSADDAIWPYWWHWFTR